MITRTLEQADEHVATCIYCNRDVREIVPPLGDDAAWAALATEHAEGCEWITTRAHRR
jgi:hypothetical protein